MENVFDDLYLYFSEIYLTSQRTFEECDLIERICDLKQGDSILDVGCGNGRISNELARRGYRVTGVDWSHPALNAAISNAKQLGVDVEYKHADFLAFKNSDIFDCVISWYTSFGYADDKASRGQLRMLNAALKPGGRILIDHINRDFSLKNLPRFSIEEREGNFMIDKFSYKVDTGFLEINRRYVKDHETIAAPYAIRLFTFPEIKDWLAYAGFDEISGMDNFGRDLALESRRMLVRGVKRQ